MVEQFSRPRHSTAQRQENQQIRAEIAHFFKELGCSVSLQGTSHNVLALPAGYTGEPIVLVGAHYDSVPETPGADDNASALAAMLCCARALSLRRHPRRVAFVAFNEEEDGLLGSLEFVRELPQSPLRVSRAHILEMVGYTDRRPNSQRCPEELPIEIPTTADFLALIGDHTSDLSRVIQHAQREVPELHVLGLKVHLDLAKELSVLQRSDHARFWERDLPATLWTDTSELRNPHYHQPSDTPDTLDYAFLQQVTELLLTTLIQS